MSAHAIWTGNLTVGLVNVGVKLYKATDDASSETACRMLHDACNTPIEKQNHCPECDVLVPYANVVKGVPSDGGFVVLSKEELAGIRVATEHSIAIDTFVPLSDVDPLFVEANYYLAPDKRQEKAFTLIVTAMEQKQRAASGRLTIYGRERNVIVRPFRSMMLLQLMRTVNEVRDIEELPNFVAKGAMSVTGPELALAGQIIDLYQGEFDTTEYEDAYLAAFNNLVAQKQTGTVIATPAAAPVPATEDLVTMLRGSLKAKHVAKKTAKPTKAAKKSAKAKK